MTHYCVTVTTRPVSKQTSWSELHAVLDAVPGCALLEDDSEPTLVCTVLATSASEAVSVIETVLQRCGVTALTIAVAPAATEAVA
jgi:hypothetical protein